MNELTKARLEELANAEYCKANPGKWLLGLAEINAMARELLALRERAEPVIREHAPVVPECFVRFHEVIKERHHGRMPEEVQKAFDDCSAILQGKADGTFIGEGTIAVEPVSQPYKLPDGWIKCSQRMPGRDGGYLTWDGRNVSNTPFLFGIWQANQHIARNITHWMPLPAAPGKEE